MHSKDISAGIEDRMFFILQDRAVKSFLYQWAVAFRTEKSLVSLETGKWKGEFTIQIVEKLPINNPLKKYLITSFSSSFLYLFLLRLLIKGLIIDKLSYSALIYINSVLNFYYFRALKSWQSINKSITK